MKTNIYLLVLLLVVSIPTIAQTNSPTSHVPASEFVVKGVVLLADDNSPLAGANIHLKGTSIGTASDAQGEFQFPKKLNVGDILIFSFVGMKTIEYPITAESAAKFSVIMEMEDFTMVGALDSDGLFTVKKRGLSRIFAGIKHNR